MKYTNDRFYYLIIILRSGFLVRVTKQRTNSMISQMQCALLPIQQTISLTIRTIKIKKVEIAENFHRLLASFDCLQGLNI